MLSNTWVIIPVKSLTEGKTRLAPAISAEDRAKLIPAMAQDVFGAFADFGELPVMVVTSDERVADLARQFDFEVLVEQSAEGESLAVAHATEEVRLRGGTGSLVVPADVPLLTAADVTKIVASAPEQGSLLVPSRSRRGTNAVLRRPCNLFPLRFGDDSFEPHCRAARNTGLVLTVLENERIGLDIDTPADLDAFLACESQTGAAKLLRSIRRG